jgi:hypothetical protein
MGTSKNPVCNAPGIAGMTRNRSEAELDAVNLLKPKRC